MTLAPGRCTLTPDCTTVLSSEFACCHRCFQLVPPDIQNQVLRAFDAMGRTLVNAERARAFAYEQSLRLARASIAGLRREAR